MKPSSCLLPALSAALLAFLVNSLPAAEEEDAAEDPAPHPVEVKVDALVEKAVSTHDMIEAYNKGTALWDAELNRTYQALRKLLPAEASEKLKTAQQQWLVYRDAQNEMLDAQYKAFDGTMYLPMRAAARMRLIEERARYLGELLELQKEHSAQ